MNQKAKKLNIRNNELDKQVNAASQEAFTNVICYLRGANISEYHQELVRQDLLEMVLSAQQRGEDIQSVIGNDYKAFCDEVIASLPPNTVKQKIVEGIDIFCWCFSILGAINLVISKETIVLIRNMFTGQELNFHISISLGMILSTIAIMVAAVAIVQYIVKNSLEKEKKKSSRKVKFFLLWIGLAAIFVLLAWLGKETLFTINIFIGCVVCAALYLLHKILEQL